MTELPEPMDDIDVAVLDALRRALAVADPVPAQLVGEVEFTLSLAAMNAELAMLADTGAGVRAPTVESADSVTFTSSTMTLMVVIGRDAGELRIDAWVSGGGITVELIQGAERVAAVSDVNGRVSWAPVQPGLARFLISPLTSGGRPVITPAIEL
ncbi:MAG: hypothetical protein HY829_02890 [Actinobacteria bacterium]|nr:hypothetical protein [Actinomycetota bacterium]